ncbi:MAG: hypothetical protein GPJ54_09450 [Candidatus Heimdallarchaeota archaeon]|nr:hypothetical protein [Candidatus Heimdallarchaeota archaeon]
MPLPALLLDDWLLLVIGILALVPAIELLVRYMRTDIVSYLIFGGVFVLSTIFTITTIAADITNSLIYWQISFSTRNLTYLLFFIHTSQMLWKKSPRLIHYTGLVLYSISQFLIIFWSEFGDDTIGAGLITNNGMELYSTDFRLLGNTFQLYVSILFVYAYYQIHLKNKSKNLQGAITLMRLMGLFLFISRFVRFIQNFGILVGEGETFVDRSGMLLLLAGFAIIALNVRRKGVIFLSRVDLEGLLVISKFGTPISSVKFSETDTRISATLISGVITAIQNVIQNMGAENDDVQFIATGDLHITLRKYSDLMLVLITKTDPTQILASSLNYFAKIYTANRINDIKIFYKTGKIIADIDEEVYQAFPYSNYDQIEIWN